MNPNALTEQELAKTIGKSPEKVREYVREGMPVNPDGTFNFMTCVAWKLLNGREGSEN